MIAERKCSSNTLTDCQEITAGLKRDPYRVISRMARVVQILWQERGHKWYECKCEQLIDINVTIVKGFINSPEGDGAAFVRGGGAIPKCYQSFDWY